MSKIRAAVASALLVATVVTGVAASGTSTAVAKAPAAKVSGGGSSWCC